MSLNEVLPDKQLVKFETDQITPTNSHLFGNVTES